MTSPDPKQIEFVAKRTLELLGGRENAIASMEADYYAMKERWDQDTQMIGRILRSHLYVEHYLTEHLQDANSGLGNIDDARLSFSQKVNLLRVDDPLVNNIIGGIRHLNRIRNRLAHNLAAEVTDEDAAIFLSQGLFRAMREARTKDHGEAPSATPIDVLEAFAEFASAMLHDRSTQHGDAFEQAVREWAEKQDGAA